ncbi:MAG: hypothetical protein NZ954_02335 [Thermofilaceae archaeon]|nr:hypothetical protein [Thermofilaceae archaeon]MCX8181269.1 hypothetical protein [Thermofilaceae archaeon]MDW8003512.1 hypothetical protein [Thermofilaceae archaeon]
MKSVLKGFFILQVSEYSLHPHITSLKLLLNLLKKSLAFRGLLATLLIRVHGV